MFFIRLIRFIVGYIVFSAQGGFPERFINLCANRGVPLWDVRCSGNQLHAVTSISGYKKIRTPARKSGMLPRIMKKKGLPFFLNQYKKRVGLLAGFIMAILIMSLLSSMIWTVDISGNEKLEPEEILAVLEENGVKKSVLKSRINTGEIEKIILEKFSDLSWASLNIMGSKAVLEVRERIEPPPMFDGDNPCNIIASRDGEITKIEISSGRPVVQLGSAVLKGDLLISGVLEGKTHISYVHAKGEVFAKTRRLINGKSPKRFEAKGIGNEKHRYTLYLFGIHIPIGRAAKEYDEYAKNEIFAIAHETVLPIGIIRERYSQYAQKEIELSDKKATLCSIADYYYKYKQELSEAEILSENIQLEKSASEHRIRGTYKAEESIGIEQHFEVETENN